MERGNRASIATFHWPHLVQPGATVTMPDDARRHALVRRLQAGDVVRVVTGAGLVGRGAITRLDRREFVIRLDLVDEVPRPPSLDVLVPIGDRDRMLHAAEKCVEHQVTGWRPVRYHRSHSVAGRGEGDRFEERVRARMVAALEQCGGAWLPVIHEPAEFIEALGQTPSDRVRLLLDAGGAPLATMVRSGAMAIAVGPEGGFDDAEVDAAARAGWLAASLGETTLRFETAVTTGAGVIRALQLATRSR